MNDLIVERATLDDVSEIFNVLKQNLIEIRDFKKIPKKIRKEYEQNGFLRKEVDEKSYKDLIQDDLWDIYVAKNNEGEILGFASIHKDRYNVKNFRSTLDNLYITDNKIEEFLTKESSRFAYLEQISILPKYKRKGVGSAIISKALANIRNPIIAFIVERPLANKASVIWHEKCGFKLVGTCDGFYKGETFEWKIFINWNKKDLP